MNNINNWAYAKQQELYYKDKIKRLEHHINSIEIKKTCLAKIEEIKKNYPDFNKEYTKWYSDVKSKLTPEFLELHKTLQYAFYHSNFLDNVLNPADKFDIKIKKSEISYEIIKNYTVDLSQFLNKKQIKELADWLKSDWEIYSNGSFISLQIILKIQEIKNNEVK